MLVLQLIITFACIFIAGMHFALWHNDVEENSIWYAGGLSVVGLWNLISLVGYVAKHAS